MPRSYFGLYGARSMTISVLPSDRRNLEIISYFIMTQCIIVFGGSGTVFRCIWKPDQGIFELDTLARIMYLYDAEACGGKLQAANQATDLVLSNDTQGLPVLPIRHAPAKMTVLSKLSGKTRKCILISCILHSIWLASAVLLRIVCYSDDIDIIKTVLKINYATSGFIIFFDCCMGVVYITHIQQSLTKAMIIRYSGYVKVHGVKGLQDFGGWVPMIASGLWLRGVIVLAWNIYCLVLFRRMLSRINKREVRSRLSDSTNVPFPETKEYKELDSSSLHYKTPSKET